MITGSNPRLSYAILGHKISFMYIKPQKGTFICPKLMPKAEKIKKQKINSVPLQTTVLLKIYGFLGTQVPMPTRQLKNCVILILKGVQS